VLSNVGYIFMQKTYQPHGNQYRYQALARFKEGNATQTKMFCDQVLLGSHWLEG
jgi:hypothetical protein